MTEATKQIYGWRNPCPSAGTKRRSAINHPQKWEKYGKFTNLLICALCTSRWNRDMFGKNGMLKMPWKRLWKVSLRVDQLKVNPVFHADPDAWKCWFYIQLFQFKYWRQNTSKNMEIDVVSSYIIFNHWETMAFQLPFQPHPWLIRLAASQLLVLSLNHPGTTAARGLARFWKVKK